MRAAYILLFFCIHRVHRTVCYTRARQAKLHQLPRPLTLLVQPYVLFQAVFFIYFLHSLLRYWNIMAEFDWFDPSTFEFTGNGARAADSQTLFAVLRYMCILSPIFVALTYVVTFAQWCVHHLGSSRDFDQALRWYPSHSHDLAMQVIALPMVYGVLALDCVVTMMQLMTGQAHAEVSSPIGTDPATAAAQVARVSLMTYHSNLELADLYEAWALRNFGRLCLMRIGRQIRREVPLLRKLLEQRNLEDDDVHSRSGIQVLERPEEYLFGPLEASTAMGVQFFVWTYGMKSLYVLIITILAGEPFFLDVQQSFPALGALLPCVEGAAFLASTVAIYNLYVLEHSFKRLLQSAGFAPILKFFAVKALVSITFIQRLVVDAVMRQILGHSHETIELCYSCALCLEVLPLSLLTVVAWRPRKGDWYCDDREVLPCVAGKVQGRLANEKDWCHNYEALQQDKQFSRQESFLAPTTPGLRMWR
eukprot:TRINITY_DN108518_c0_g1_i1.p1 TRINITY_DN108518_c0_g1~~TRINITY_DN108518_c0_g1_i1.p1  ORF type:complete len:477 (-),score=77.86 TRINITY_DN108518_c0_g1_i1:92-1522(-)